MGNIMLRDFLKFDIHFREPFASFKNIDINSYKKQPHFLLLDLETFALISLTLLQKRMCVYFVIQITLLLVIFKFFLLSNECNRL